MTHLRAHSDNPPGHGYIGPTNIERSSGQDDPARAEFVDQIERLIAHRHNGRPLLVAGSDSEHNCDITQ